MSLAELIEPDLETLPFSEGDGPFHIKGTALRGALEFNSQRPAVQDPRLSRYLDEPVLAGTWYDAFVSAAIDFAAERAHNPDPPMSFGGSSAWRDALRWTGENRAGYRSNVPPSSSSVTRNRKLFAATPSTMR